MRFEKRPDGLTPLQGAICDYLKERGCFVGATVIGMDVGKRKYTSASSWAFDKLKRLVEMGKVISDGKGHYKVASPSPQV